MSDIRTYEHREQIASFRHSQSLLRSKLLNLNTICMVLMVMLLGFGVYRIVHMEQALIERIDFALFYQMHKTTPTPHPL